MENSYDAILCEDNMGDQIGVTASYAPWVLPFLDDSIKIMFTFFKLTSSSSN